MISFLPRHSSCLFFFGVGGGGGLGSECPLDSGLGKGVRCCSITQSCPRGISGVDGGESPPLFPKYFLKVKWGRGSR